MKETMWTISKTFQFSASHQLDHLKDGHPCKELHGHNYTATFEFSANRLNENSFVIDYRELKTIKVFIDSTLDHNHLNKVMIETPTVENISKLLFETFKPTFPLLVAVSVSETDGTNCRYEPGRCQ